jgi:hypothetical protein
MSAFAAALRTEIDQAQRSLVTARHTDDGDALHRYAARLLDLLDRAKAHGVDTSDWVSRETLAVASAAAGDEA